MLDEAGVGYEFEVRSAHRTPDAVAEYARTRARPRLRVLICGAGLAAALPGAGRRAHRPAGDRRPAPLEPQRARRSRRAARDRADAARRPVAAVGVDNARNAAALALRILNA